jgi:hypothetical protein
MIFWTPPKESTSTTWPSSGRLMRKMDMVKRYQMRVSVYMLCVLLCALTAKGWFLAAWVIAGCPADREYVYVEGGAAGVDQSFSVACEKLGVVAEPH